MPRHRSSNLQTRTVQTETLRADATRVGVTGASGGGTQTFILDAVDDRVTVAAPVNMISSTMQGGCICENAPLLRIGTNNMEIGGVFAPKPLLPPRPLSSGAVTASAAYARSRLRCRKSCASRRSATARPSCATGRAHR